MSTSHNIKSILHPDKIAYRVVSDWSDHWNQRGDNTLALRVVVFETYGDGTTQHSGAWCPQLREVTDVCLSITAAILENPTDEAWQAITDLLNYCSAEAMDFALSVKYEEEKTRYYSLAERKLTSSAAKRNDRRYNLVEKWHNGSPGSAFNIMMGGANWDWLVRLFVLDELREKAGYWPQWEELVPASVDFVGDWHSALNALKHALQSVDALDRARRASACAVHNSQKEVEPAAIAA